MLKLDKISKDYGNGKGVQQLSFQIAQGKICGVLGSNGCGKTTTFRILLGLLKKDSGNITFLKKPIVDSYRIFGYVPEERSMLRNLTLKEHVTYLAKLKKMSEARIEENLNYWLDFLKVSEYRDVKIIELSKGNQQKVQIICALIHDPKIIIFDEPLNGLDVMNVDIFKKVLLKLKKDKKIILLSSHQYHNIEQFCDQIVYLKDGKIVFKGDIEKLKLKKKSRFLKIHSKRDLFKKEKGILSYHREKEYLVLEVEDKQRCYELIIKLIEMKIEDFSMELISLQEIIKGKSI